MAKLEFMLDFASPNAYYCHKVLPEILQRTGAELEVVPVLLGGLFKLTDNQAPFVAFGGVKGKMDYELLESKRFQEKHQLNEFVFNSHFPMNTITVMRGLVAAQDLGVAAAYIEAVMLAMWEQGQKMDDLEVVAQVWRDAGLDADALLTMIQTDAVKESLKQSTQAAADRGAFGVPTFFVGDEIFFGKERLGQVEEELLK
ncbi:2-hydroxychromene-2-carboxylate isomerase [Halioglobus maricola]|uniref:2-hydroxychromene-2-carboxylate isomerase n=1 Tax=Halioglobus maricola TaxID=2601894 RepID=A0A5P9NIG4_9GAMM|nr:2-hydroxychromene-2-carboxylate isomerase [Halioglobus maricola]QFU75617.1 2-hydroxychromene-2-carboxylate isomerase [Halioglobus maricola]